MDLFKKQKIKFLAITTIAAAIIALLALGTYFAVTYTSSMKSIERTLTNALSQPANIEMMPLNKQCIMLKVENGTIIKTFGLQLYPTNIANEIERIALITEEDTFEISNYHFMIKSKDFETSTLYAIYDYTSYHESILTMCSRLGIIYVCIIIISLILAYLASDYLLSPVKKSLKKQKDLTANASHELKTPLTVINANLEVIKSDPASTIEDNEKWLQSIEDQIKRMQGLITNMLELSKLEQTELVKERLNFSDIVNGECLTIEPILFEKGIELVTDVAPNLFINGEKDSLQRLIVILLDNAAKYCGDKGKVGITMLANKKNAVLSVLNTGIVISKEESEHVFDRFYRSDGARKNDDKQSFGLGLSIAAATVHSHNGTISCHGVENKGTVFTVTIPLIK